uniref:Reverse transcriptase domain-containing protein n=1 Tax=Caenorhabditis tropicalis TaxID=1561998 RepID=A0A1I7UFD4_9PELO
MESEKSYQRLEWITDVLTAAIQKVSAGDEQAIEKIEKRCASLEVSAGEMCTQAEPKKRQRQESDTPQCVSKSTLRKEYNQNRAKTFNRIIGKDSKQCEIPIERLQKFFEGTTEQTNVPKEVLEKMGSRLPKREKLDWMEMEFSEQEIKDALKKTKNMAPGVDGLRYHHLKW